MGGSPHLALLFVLTTGIGAAMLRLGLSRGALERRRTPRRCPSCGRIIARRVCATCSVP